MAFTINDFKANLLSGGARPNAFEVQITNPITGIADFKMPFMIYAASLPEQMVNNYEVYYMGRATKYPGNRIFQDWTVEIYNDEDFAVRNALEIWSNAINSHVGNISSYPRQYKAQAQVTQLARDGTRLREYTFEGLYPQMISPIQLSWEADGIERFTVTFQYDLWRNSGGVTGSSTT